MLHPASTVLHGPAAILSAADLRHGVFGDRDAGRGQERVGVPRGCGLFGRLSTDPALPPRNPPRDAGDPPPPAGRA